MLTLAETIDKEREYRRRLLVLRDRIIAAETRFFPRLWLKLKRRFV